MPLDANMIRLMDNARLRLPGALEDGITMELFSLLDDFFQKTNCWYEDIQFTPLPGTESYFENPGLYTYDVIPSMGSVTRLVGVVDATGAPVSASMPIIGQVVIAYPPSEATTYTARVYLTVSDPVTTDGYPQFPSWVLTKYGTGMLDGLIGRMMSQIAKPYTSTTAAVFHMRKFNKMVSSAKSEANHHNVHNGQNWRFPSFAPGQRFRG